MSELGKKLDSLITRAIREVAGTPVKELLIEARTIAEKLDVGSEDAWCQAKSANERLDEMKALWESQLRKD